MARFLHRPADFRALHAPYTAAAGGVLRATGPGRGARAPLPGDPGGLEAQRAPLRRRLIEALGLDPRVGGRDARLERRPAGPHHRRRRPQSGRLPHRAGGVPVRTPASTPAPSSTSRRTVAPRAPPGGLQPPRPLPHRQAHPLHPDPLRQPGPAGLRRAHRGHHRPRRARLHGPPRAGVPRPPLRRTIPPRAAGAGQHPGPGLPQRPSRGGPGADRRHRRLRRGEPHHVPRRRGRAGRGGRPRLLGGDAGGLLPQEPVRLRDGAGPAHLRRQAPPAGPHRPPPPAGDERPAGQRLRHPLLPPRRRPRPAHLRPLRAGRRTGRRTARLARFETNAEHSYDRPMRERAYAWFDQWLKGRSPEAAAAGCGEADTWVEAEEDDTLRVWGPFGSRRGRPGGRPHPGRLLRRRTAAAAGEAPGRRRRREDLRRRIVDGLFGGWPERHPPAPRRRWTPSSARTAPSRCWSTGARTASPSPPSSSARLGGSPGTARDARTPRARPWSTPARPARPGPPSCAPSTRPSAPGSPSSPSTTGARARRPGRGRRKGSYRPWSEGSCSTGPSSPGRVWDVLRGAEYLAGRPDVDPQAVSVWGERETALLALHAAALDSGWPAQPASTCPRPTAGPLASRSPSSPGWWCPGCWPWPTSRTCWPWSPPAPASPAPRRAGRLIPTRARAGRARTPRE